MKYMLLIYGVETALSQPERETCYAESIQFTHQLQAQGQFIAAAPLQLSSTAVNVRFKDGQSVVTDGPFAETHEQLGGYFLVEAKDQAEAVSIAEKLPGAKWGTIEVRPIVELTGLPEEN